MDEPFQFSDDFFRERAIQTFGGPSAVPVIAYSQGPPLPPEAMVEEDITEISIVRCECGEPIGPVAGQFLAAMEREQGIIYSQTGKRMTTEEFSRIGLETLVSLLGESKATEIVDRKRLPTYEEVRIGKKLSDCCKDAIDDYLTNPESSLVEEMKSLARCYACRDRSAPQCESCSASSFTCATCLKGITKELYAKMRDPTPRPLRVPKKTSSYWGRTCCLMNIWEPIAMRWNLEKPKRLIEGEARPDIKLGNGNMIITGNPRYESQTVDYYGKPMGRGKRTVGEIKKQIPYNPYAFVYDTAYDTMFGEGADEMVLDNIPADSNILPAAVSLPTNDIFFVDDSLFPAMPEAEEMFVSELVQQQLVLTGPEEEFSGVRRPEFLISTDEQEMLSTSASRFGTRSTTVHPQPQVVGIASTGLLGYEVPVISRAYVVR